MITALAILMTIFSVYITETYEDEYLVNTKLQVPCYAYRLVNTLKVSEAEL